MVAPPCTRRIDLPEGADQLLVGTPFLGREGVRRRFAGQGRRVDFGGNGGGHVGVDGEQARGRLQAHLVHDERTPVAALGDVAVVAETPHQLRPCSRHALRAPAGVVGLPEKP